MRRANPTADVAVRRMLAVLAGNVDREDGSALSMNKTPTRAKIPRMHRCNNPKLPTAIQNPIKHISDAITKSQRGKRVTIAVRKMT